MRYTPRRARPGEMPTTYVFEVDRPGTTERLAGHALSATALLGTLCLLLFGAGALLGIRAFVVQSGSMAPTMPTGSLVVTRSVDTASVGPGEVVSVVGRDGARVTHRVESVDTVGGVRGLHLRGDANVEVDRERIVAPEVDRVVLTVPSLGSALARLADPPVPYLAGLASGAGILWAFSATRRPRLGAWVPSGTTRHADGAGAR